MMKIENLIFDGKGIFNYIEQTGLLPFMDNAKADEVDTILLSYHGDKELSRVATKIIGGEVNDLSLSKLAGVMIIEYLEKWIDTQRLLLEELTGDSYRMKETSTLTKKGQQEVTTSKDTTNTSTESVTGFNELDFVDDNKQVRSDKDSFTSAGNNADTQTLIKETIGNTKSKVSELYSVLRFLKQNQLYDIMITDVVESVGNLIY